MPDYSFSQSEADTILFSTYIVLQNSGYNGPVVIDSADTDAYVCGSSSYFTEIPCIKRKQDTILCCNLVPEEMASCIIPLHCLTGCDANSGFFGKGKLSVYDKVARSAEAWELLSKCGNSLDIEEEAIEELFKFTRTVIYNNKMSKTMGTARAAKWKAMKKKSFIRLPADVDSLHQHCLRANYLAYLINHPSLKDHPSPLVAVVLFTTHILLSQHIFLNLN